jgi:hypothetical protein
LNKDGCKRDDDCRGDDPLGDSESGGKAAYDAS